MAGRSRVGAKVPAGVTIDERTKSMTPKVINCRAWRHWWLVIPSPHNRRGEIANMARQGLRERHLKCQQCGADRHIVLDIDGGVVSTTIKYPEGYLVEAGTGKLALGDARNAADFLF